MKSYYRVTLGKGNMHAQDCFAGNFIGVDFVVALDLTGKLPDEWRDFNKEFIPVFLKAFPGKTRIAAGLACGGVWTFSRGIQSGDIVLCPDGEGHFHVGEVIGDYYFQKGENLPHRRPVKWLNKTIERAKLDLTVRRAIGVVATIRNITSQAEEIEKLLMGTPASTPVSAGETVEDPAAFAMEKHLEEFLVQNWKQTEMGKDYDIYQEDGEIVGQQYQTDTGPIDILAIGKDKRTLLVIELKKGRASDVVVGQTLPLQRRFALLRRFEYYYDMSRGSLKFPSYTPWRILPEGERHEKDYSISVAFESSATGQWTATETGHSSKRDDGDPRVDRLPSSV